MCRGDFGRLGHGNSSDVFIPQPIKALYGLRIKQIACGDSHCLAVSMEGDVQRLVAFIAILMKLLFIIEPQPSVCALLNITVVVIILPESL